MAALYQAWGPSGKSCSSEATMQLVGHIDNGIHPVVSNDWLRWILYSNQES